MSTNGNPLATEDPKPFDPAAHLRDRNAAELAARTGKEPPKAETQAAEAPKPAIKTEEADEKEHAHLPRSARREMNRLREQAAEERGRRIAIEEMLAKNAAVPAAKATPADDDPEPQRKDFPDDASYNRAAGKWDVRQETKKELAKSEEKTAEAAELEQYKGVLQAAETQARKDIDEIWGQEGYNKIAEENKEALDAIEYVPADHLQLMMLIGQSMVKARVMVHFALHPSEFQAMLDLSKDPTRQIREFHQLEGMTKVLYTPKDKKKQEEAAQASGKSKDETKDRTHPADASPAGRTTADAVKPKPSNEVAARGGSPPPEEPEPGTKAWMERRNMAERAR